MNLLVTGGAGFIGSHFVLRHVAQFPADKVVVLDKLTYAADKKFLGPVLSSIEFIEGDIVDTSRVSSLVSQFSIDAIVNFAAESHVDRSIEDVRPFIHTNILGIHSLIDVCKKHPGILLLHVSTDEVYGERKDDESPCTLDSPLLPGNPYSATKAAGDLALLAAARTHGIKVRITRCTNNYGPHQAAEKFLPTVILHALKKEPIPVYGEGKNKRDWLYVGDHCDAVELVLEQGKNGHVYLIGADAERENVDVARKVLDLLGLPHNLIAFVPDRPGHDWRYALDSSAIRKMRWAPKVSFEEGLKKTVEWYRGRVTAGKLWQL